MKLFEQVNSNTRVIGVDEVGRGPLAGPVVAAAVCFQVPPPDNLGVADSKKLSPQRRLALFQQIDKCASWAIGWIEPAEIDWLNIRQATLVAMYQAVIQLNPGLVLVDGRDSIPGIKFQQTVIGGDNKYIQIAAASIMAKVVRDEYMYSLAKDHPEYGWHTNVGYATKTHRQAILDYGVTDYHRRSFLKKLLSKSRNPKTVA